MSKVWILHSLLAVDVITYTYCKLHVWYSSFSAGKRQDWENATICRIVPIKKGLQNVDKDASKFGPNVNQRNFEF